MFFNLFFYQSFFHVVHQIQSLTQSFWGWIVLFLVLIAAIDVVLAAVFLVVRNQSEARPVVEEISNKRSLTLKIIHNREACDLKVALEKLQEDHVAAVLKAIRLSDSNIPGIMPLVKHRLAAQGIQTAFDARIERMLPMRWLGEVPLRALLQWRCDLEASARQSMPHRLSSEQAAQIHARYEALRQEIAGEGI